MNYLTSINSKTNNVVSLNSSFIGNSTNISRASETYVPANPVALNIYTFPLDNPNIKKFIQNMPDKIGYSLDIKSNPLGNVTSGNDFYYKNHKLKAYFNMEIPLSITLDELSLQEIVDFDINKNDKKSIKDGVFTLIADNGFPFSVIIQFYMLDENETIIDSLLTTTNFVLSAPIDFNYKVTGKKRTILKMLISEEKMRLHIGETGTVALPGDRRLKITPLRVTGNRAELQLLIFKKERQIIKTRIQVLNHSSITVGGPEHKGGFLLFDIFNSF